MKSKKKLFEFLKAKYGKELSLDTPGITDETYGKDSCIYIWNTVETLGVTRDEAIRELRAAGFRCSDEWGRDDCKGNPLNGVEIHVSFFKGWHWDE